MLPCRYRAVKLLLFVLLCLHPLLADLTPKQQAANVESFEKVWSTVRDRHPDVKLAGLDWQAVRSSTLPKIRAAKSMDEVRDLLSEMLHRLGTSHYGIVPGNVYNNMDAERPVERGSTGLRASVIDGKAVVASVEPGSPADKAGIRPGMVVDDVDGTAMAPMIESIAGLKSGESELTLSRTLARKLAGSANEPVALKVRDRNGKQIEAKLEREAPKGEIVTFGNLPPVRLIFESRMLPSGVGYISFNFFLNPVTVMPQFENAMRQFAKAPGVILDLRGNPGGIGFLATGIAGFFLDESGLSLGEMKTRELALKFAIFPRAETYSGPLAVLIDGGSASTSEILAGGLQDMKRARIFGTRSAGAALPSDFIRLPNGDGFQFVVATYTSQSGKVLEANGVTPDVEVRQTEASLAEGGDPVVQAADSWISMSKKK